MNRPPTNGGCFMPIQPTYPGVYIEELPSGVHTITGVPTSVTAFLGRAGKGPANEQTIITSYADFERRFGGMGVDYPMSYAVRDFYLNGGSEAVIVRLFKSAVAGSDGVATVDLGNGLKLKAIGPGTWANTLQVTVNTDGITDQIAQSYGLQKSDLFNLIVQNDPANNGPREIFRNLSVVNGPRRIYYALNSSQFLRLALPY